MTIQEQIKAYLESSPVVMSIAVGGIWTRPLSRGSGNEESLLGGDLDPTPEAFDEVGWVLPSVVISPRLDTGGYYGPVSGANKFMVFSPTLAYYAPPTDQQGGILQRLSLMCMRVLKGKRVQYADGEFGHIVIPHEVTGSVEIPEMPNSGVVMIERIEVAAVFDRT